ncbi:hypothetical protein HBB16_13595 [Pseudonocardia sp. MCCB 268]|nr:hypothetical protein [Pseudonocardia cytotoxica]
MPMLDLAIPAGHRPRARQAHCRRGHGHPAGHQRGSTPTRSHGPWPRRSCTARGLRRRVHPREARTTGSSPRSPRPAQRPRAQTTTRVRAHRRRHQGRRCERGR